MTEEQARSSKPFDPLEPFRGMRDAYLDAMAKAMVEAVNTEGYAQATGAMLDNTLTISAPFREAMEKSMLQVLEQLSLPSRQDILALAERFSNLEMRLDDIDAKLDRIEKQTTCRAVGCPGRTRKESELVPEGEACESRESKDACRYEACGTSQTSTSAPANCQKRFEVEMMRKHQLRKIS